MKPTPVQSRLSGWPSVALAIAALYFAREVFIPIALSILLSFLLSPLVMRLRRWGWSKVLAVVVVAVVAFTIILGIGGLVTYQLYDLAESLPEYKENIQGKLKAFRASGGGVLNKAIRTLEDLQTNNPAATVTNAPTAAENPAAEPPAAKPIPVEIHRPAPTTLDVLKAVLGNLLKPLATAGIVIVFVVFMLLQREDLRNRFLGLVGLNQLSVTTQALDETASRVSRFLLMQLLVNATYGIPIGIGLYFIGIPNAFTWGLLATLLRFIPYVGPIVTAALPIGLAFAIDPGWLKPVLTVLLFVTVELISNNIIEPWLYGTSTGISSFAIIVAAVFWTWLWGTVGLLMATPLTVCLAVLGRYVPQLQFLDILLGDEPVLSEDARFYQRLLARDTDEAAELVEELLKKESLEHTYDKVLIPAMSLAEHDRHQGNLDPVKEKFILDSTRQIVEEFGVSDDKESNTLTPAAAGDAITVLCIPANDEADEVCGIMLSHLLQKKGVSAKPVSAESLTTERIAEIREHKVPIVCVSALPPSALRQARLLCKKLRSEFPHLKIVVGVWTQFPDLAHISSRLPSGLIDHVATHLPEAVEIIRSIHASPAPQSTEIAA